MRSKKQILLGVINIAANPHTDDGRTYIELLQAAFQLDLSVQIRGDDYAYLASCIKLNETSELSPLTGEIHKFTEIAKEDWENRKTRKAASAEELKAINIPDYLKANSAAFRYFLFPKEHRFVFQLDGEKRDISYEAVLKLLKALFAQPSIKERFPLVSVIAEQEPEALEQIFRMPQLNKLFITLNLPNSDGATKDEIAFAERWLREQHASKAEINLTHTPGQSLTPDSLNKMLARVATSYGEVVGKGKDENNRPLEIKTSSHPIRERFDFDRKEKLSFVDQMFKVAQRLAERVTKRPKPIPLSIQATDEHK